jgi:hypothetical protein
MFQMETGDLGLLGPAVVSLVEVEPKPDHEHAIIQPLHLEVLLALAQEQKVKLAALKYVSPILKK